MTPSGPAGGVGPEMAAAPEAWLDEGRQILERQSAASWEFADWLASDEAPDIPDRDIAGYVKVSREKINQYRSTSRTYPSGIRIPPLTFSHHRLARALPEEERMRLLKSAAAEDWPLKRLRDAVREASTEGKLRRQAAEIRELKRQLKAAEIEARSAAERIGSRLRAERGVAVTSLKRYAADAEELAAPELLERLHGNGRLGLARRLERDVAALVEGLNAQIERIDTALPHGEGRDMRLRVVSALDAPEKSGEKPANSTASAPCKLVPPPENPDAQAPLEAPSTDDLSPIDGATNAQRERAVRRLAAVDRSDDLVADGIPRSAADRIAGEEIGAYATTVGRWRKQVAALPRGERLAALLDSPRTGRPRGGWAAPGAERLWDLFLTDWLREGLDGDGVTAWDIHRRLADVADARGWELPPVDAFIRRERREIPRQRARAGAQGRARPACGPAEADAARSPAWSCWRSSTATAVQGRRPGRSSPRGAWAGRWSGSGRTCAPGGCSPGRRERPNRPISSAPRSTD